MAEVRCSCGYQKKVDDKYMGKKASCPKCQKPVVVQAIREAPITVSAELVPEPYPEPSTSEQQCPFLNSLSVRCPHCEQSFSLGESSDYHISGSTDIVSKQLTQLKDKSSELGTKAKDAIKQIDTEKAKKSFAESFTGENRHIYILLSVLAILIVIPLFLDGDFYSRVPSILQVLGLWSMFFVYFDATKNKIGKVPGQKSFLWNNSAGLWSFGTLMLWILVFPVYLKKRTALIKLAKDHPVNVGNVKRFIVLGIISLVLISATLVGPRFYKQDLAQSARPLVSKILKDNHLNGKCIKVRIGDKYAPGYYHATAMLDNSKELKITVQDVGSQQIYVRIPSQ